MPQRNDHAEPMTVSELAEATNEKRFRIEYILAARQIQPCRRVGNCRLYPPATLDFLRAELARIDRDRAGVL